MTDQSAALSGPLTIAIVATSQRKASNSAKAAAAAQRILLANDDVAAAPMFDLGQSPLPAFSVDPEGKQARTDAFAPLKAALESADGLLLVTPEWNGMASPSAKDLMNYCGGALVGHKAGMILSVSTGMGGTYPVAELRMTGTKNNRLCWTPDHVILRKVDKVLDAIEAEGMKAKATDWEDLGAQRLHYGLDVLRGYARALRLVRSSGLINFDDFQNGL